MDKQYDGQAKKDSYWSTKYWTENKRSSNTKPTKTWCGLRCSGRVSNSCSTSGTSGFTLVTNPDIRQEYEYGNCDIWNGKDLNIIINCIHALLFQLKTGTHRPKTVPHSWLIFRNRTNSITFLTSLLILMYHDPFCS